MEAIESFLVDHLKLLTGLYVSRVDSVGEERVTTFDLRMTRPNKEPVMGAGAIHAIEHLGATFLRNHEGWAKRMVYFGPMGCRTGFYMIVAGDATPEDVFALVKDMLLFIASFEGAIPGASPIQCGNHSDMDLPAAKRHALKYLSEVFERPDAARFRYPS
jgi:S-ribosylhomocysteine lyase